MGEIPRSRRKLLSDLRGPGNVGEHHDETAEMAVKSHEEGVQNAAFSRS